MNKIELRIYWKGFKKGGVKELFDERSQLNIRFDEFEYVLTGLDRNQVYVKKRYAETITENEYQTIVSQIVKSVFESIKSSVERFKENS